MNIFFLAALILGSGQPGLSCPDSIYDDLLCDTELIFTIRQANQWDDLERLAGETIVGIGQARVSPNRRKIVFVVEFEDRWGLGPVQSGIPQSDLFLFDLARSRLRRLTWSRTNREPAWSPDGRSIAYSGEGSIRVFPIAGSDTRIRTLLRGYVIPGGGEYGYMFYEQPAWSPDGKTIAALGGGGGGYNLYVAEAYSGRLILDPVDCDEGVFEWRTPESLWIPGSSDSDIINLPPDPSPRGRRP